MKRGQVTMKIIVGLFLLATIPLLARSGIEQTPYQDIMAKSDLIVIGRVLEGEVLQLEGVQRPRATPLPQRRKDGVPTPLVSHLYSWDRNLLHNPDRLWAYRARVSVLHVTGSGPAEGTVITIDLGYGMTRKAVEDYVALEYPKTWTLTGSEVIFHLRRLPLENGSSRVYEMITKAWPIDPADLQEHKTNMDIRLERFRAFGKIEQLIEGYHQARRDQLDELIELSASLRDELGEVDFTGIEIDLLERLEARTRSGAANQAEWRRWWNSTKNGYINAPFRIMVTQ